MITVPYIGAIRLFPNSPSRCKKEKKRNPTHDRSSTTSSPDPQPPPDPIAAAAYHASYRRATTPASFRRVVVPASYRRAAGPTLSPRAPPDPRSSAYHRIPARRAPSAAAVVELLRRRPDYLRRRLPQQPPSSPSTPSTYPPPAPKLSSGVARSLLSPALLQRGHTLLRHALRHGGAAGLCAARQFNSTAWASPPTAATAPRLRVVDESELNLRGRRLRPFNYAAT